MKLTRQEAQEILGVEDGAEHRALKMAYYKKSKEWHPDKVEEEKKEEATLQFQLINAAYQKLLNNEPDEEDFSEDEEYGFYDMEAMFDFFRYMEAKMHVQQARRSGPVVGDMFGAGPMAFEMGPGGPRVVWMGAGLGLGPGVFGSFARPEEGGRYGGGGGRGRGGRGYGGRRRQQDYYESDSEGDISSVSSDDSEYERYQERMFMRMKAEERAAEQDRVRQQYDDANRARRAAEEQDNRWLAQLSRPARVSFSDTSITLDVDRGSKKRTADFLSGQLPDRYFWELQYRPIIAGQPLGAWETLEVGGAMEVTVTGLEPGTRYAFRARPCKHELPGRPGAKGVDEEVVRCGEWSVEAQHSTSGSALQRASTTAKPAEEAPTSRRRERKAKQAAVTEESEAVATWRRAQEAAAAAQREAAKAARLEAEQQKERDRQAAIARAAAEYEMDAKAARQRAEKDKPGAAAAAKKAAKADTAPAKAAAAPPVQRQPSSGSLGNLSRSSSTAGGKAEVSQAATGPARRAANGATSSSSGAKPGSSGTKAQAAATAAAVSSVPPEFRLPADYVSPAQQSHAPSHAHSRPAAGQRASALRDAIGSAPAMRAPMRRSEVQQQQQARRAPFAAGPTQPTALGRAAASGDFAVVTSGAFAAEAAAAGMTPDQYLAYQEDLVVQEVLVLSAAENEVQLVAGAEDHSVGLDGPQSPLQGSQQPAAAPSAAPLPGARPLAPPLPAVPAAATPAAPTAGPHHGSAGGRGDHGERVPSSGRSSASGRGRGRGRGRQVAHPEQEDAAAVPAGVEPAVQPALEPQQRKPRIVTVPRSAVAPPLPAAFAPASGRNSVGGGDAGEALPEVTSPGRPVRVREGHAPYRPPSGQRSRAGAPNGAASSAAASASIAGPAASAPEAEDDPYGWGALLQEQPAAAEQQAKAAGKPKKGKASKGSKKGQVTGGAAGEAVPAEEPEQPAFDSQPRQWQQPTSDRQQQDWEQPAVAQQQHWEQRSAAQQQWDATRYQQQRYLPQPQPLAPAAASSANGAANPTEPYQPAAQGQLSISFGDFGSATSPRLSPQQPAPMSASHQAAPHQLPAATAAYQPHYVDPAGVHYVAVPAAQAQQAQQAAFQSYLAGQPAPSAYNQPAQHYYGAQWEAPMQQYSWSREQAQQAQQYTSSSQGGGGYQQPDAQANASFAPQKLSPETAAHRSAGSDSSSSYSAPSSSYLYAPQQAAAATPGNFAQPTTPAQAPAPYRPPSRPTAYRPHLGPPAAGAGSNSSAVSSQQPARAPNLSVLLPGSR